MATPTQLRNQLRGLTRLAQVDLDFLMRRTLSETALKAALPPLVEVYGAAAATVAAEWYDEFRDAQNARGRFRAIPAEIADSGEDALVGWAFAEATDGDAFKVLLSGGLQRRIANFGRFTITASAVEDPASDGWIRVGTGACKSGWCDQYLDGEIRTIPYDFPAHDHCTCAAVPAF